MTQRQWSAWIAATVLILVFISLVWLIEAWLETHSALRAAQTRLADVRERRLDPDKAEAMKRVLNTVPEPQEGLLIGSETEAVSRFDAQTRSLAQDIGAEILSASFAVDKVGNNLPVVRGNVHLMISDGSIGALLKSLEGGSPAVFLERIRISYRSDPGENPDELMLDLTASLIAYHDAPMPERSMP